MSSINLKEKFEELKKKFLENKNDEVIRECKNILKKDKIDINKVKIPMYSKLKCDIKIISNLF